MAFLRAALLLSIAFQTASIAGNKKDDPSEIGNRDVGGGFNCYSLEKEIAMGKQLAGEVSRQAKLVEDPLITEYINRVGQNLARNSDAKVPFSFQVIDDPALNAFALPGGFIFVNTGLITAAETEAEMASAMAHEVAHVAARHMTRQQCKVQLANAASLPLIFLGGWGGYAARQAAGAVIPMSFLSFSRTYESEADFLGVQYLYAAGYDPIAAVDMFEKMMSLQRQKPGSIAKVFSSHPMNEDRLKKTQDEIARILPQKAEYIVNTSEYNTIRARWLAVENERRTRAVEKDPKAPVLRRSPGSGAPGENAPEERPTIKRRDLSE